MRPLTDGYEIRPPSFDDVEGVAEVLLANDLSDIGESDLDADFVRDQWSAPGLDLSEDSWAITDPNGTIVAHANLSPDGEGKLKSWGVVHPEHRRRGLGSALLDRLEARASDRLRGVASAVLHGAVTDTDTDAGELVWTRGFERMRTFRHLKIDLDGSPRDPGEPPAGIEIRGIEPERDLRRVHAIFVEAFSGEWGYRPIPFEEWVGLEVETPSYDPSL
jgi:mycothiol synthase